MVNLGLEVGQHLNLMVPYSDRLIQCDAQVLTASGPTVMITPPMRHRVKVPVQADHVFLMVPRSDALYEIRCPSEQVEPELWSITLPGKDGTKRIQRRQYVRVGMSRLCSLIVDPTLGEVAAPPLSGELVDLSGGGCSVRTDHPLSPGASVTLVCGLVEEHRPQRLRGTVRRCSQINGTRLLAIEFKELPALEQNALIQLVQSFDLARRQPGERPAPPSRQAMGTQPSSGKKYDRSRFKDWYR